MLIFAGPNGSGKTTVAQFFDEQLAELGAERINADEIAQDMFERRGGQLSDYSEAAANESDRRVMRAIAESRDFAVETVLSSSKFIGMIQAAKKASFFIITVFVYLRDPQTNIQRIANRVAKHGHPVPDEKVITRYPKSLKNLEWASSMSNWTYVYENDRDAYPTVAASCLEDGWAAHDQEAYLDFVDAVRPHWTEIGLKRLL